MKHPLSSIALYAIGLYRRYLSPLKGYRCAYGALHGTSTCSGQGLRIFRRAGRLKGLKLLGRQFDHCTLAAAQLRSQNSSNSDGGKYQRLRPMSAIRRRPGYGGQQAGFVDCDCGAGGGDCTPDCDLDCGKGRSSKLCNLDFLDCCSGCDSPCDSKKDQARSQERARRAAERQAARIQAREQRRMKRSSPKDERKSFDVDSR